MGLKMKTLQSKIFLFIVLPILVFSGCNSVEKREDPKPLPSLEQLTKKASTMILEPLLSVSTKKSYIVILPFVNKKGEPCHLGEKMAQMIAKDLSFKKGHAIKEVNWKDFFYGNYLLADSLLIDFVIAGKVLQKQFIEVFPEIIDVKNRRKKEIPPLYIQTTPYLEKLYNLLLTAPSEGGYPLEEGTTRLGEKILQELETLEEVRRIVFYDPGQVPFIQQVEEKLFGYFSDPSRYGNRVFRQRDYSKAPVIEEGKEILVQFEYAPFGKKRILITLFLREKKGDWKKFLKILFKK